MEALRISCLVLGEGTGIMQISLKADDVKVSIELQFFTQTIKMSVKSVLWLQKILQL